MDLRSTILGILSRQAASGYDLKRIISDSEIFYWSGNNNQIYTTLLELQNEGLITNEVQIQEKLPAKKVYSITAPGRAELHKHLLAEPELPEIRKGFLIQLAMAEPLRDAEVLELLRKYHDEMNARLRMHLAQVRVLAAGAPTSPGRSAREQYLWKRVAENIAASDQAELDWVQQTIEDLRVHRFTG